MSLTSPIVALFWLCLFVFSYCRGSTINLTATPTDIKNGLTSTLTLRCWLNATATRRDLGPVAAVTSLVVMRDGDDVASVTATRPARATRPWDDLHVTGDLHGHGGDLQLTFTNPNVNQSGQWSCEANAISDSGHAVTFDTPVEVSLTTPTSHDVIAAVRQLAKTNADLLTKQQDLERTIADLKSNGSHANVFFSVGLSTPLNAVVDQVIVYDKVFSNVGNSYDAQSGVFTCRHAGHYQFTITALNSFQERHYVSLQKNYQNVIAVYARKGTGNGEQGANTAILRLQPGDLVQVMAHRDSHLYNRDPAEIYTTFTGLMVAAV